MIKFRVHASQGHKILGRIGLTDKQKIKMDELRAKKTPRTDLQEIEFDNLVKEFSNPTLPDTLTTHLKEFYADLNEQINTPPINKGNMCEQETIELLAEVLNEPLAEKNMVTADGDEYMVGTCDILMPDVIYDVKSVWSKKTLNDKVDLVENEYFIQGQIYMYLYNRKKFILFYGLVNTPEEVNYGMEVTYDQWPINERWIAYEIQYDQTVIDRIIERVKLCRIWLENYDKEMKSKLGRIVCSH